MLKHKWLHIYIEREQSLELRVIFVFTLPAYLRDLWRSKMQVIKSRLVVSRRPALNNHHFENCPTQWASYQIRKIAGCACAGNAGNVSPRRQFQRKPLVSDPGMYHGTCVTHVPWCMSGSLTCDDGENVPGIPGACAPAILRIWQEAHGLVDDDNYGWYKKVSNNGALGCIWTISH